MKNPCIRTCLVWLAGIGLMLPHVSWAKQPVQNPHVRRTLDVKLHGEGMLIGQLVNPQGKAKSGVAVRVFRKNKELIHTKTDRQGRFAFKGLKGGNYKLATKSLAVPVRAWPQTTAPPKVATGALLVEGTIVRGQLQLPTGSESVQIPAPEPVAAEPVPMNGPTYSSTGSYAGSSAGASGGQGLLGMGFGGGGILSSPLLISAGIAAAVAVPVALDDDDDDAGGSGDGGAGEPAS